jgi:hypothetical protein
MTRRTETLDPEIARELEALEAALAGAPGADPDLSALVRDVRAQAPPMAPAFADRLDERVREGFPRKRRFPSRRVLVPALGFAASVLLAIVVVANNGADEHQPASLSAPVAAEQDSSASSGASSGASTAAPAPAAKSVAPAPPQTSLGGTRRVERSAQLTLTTARDDVQNVSDDVIAVTQAAGGVVASSQVETGDGGGSASFDLRIPTAKLDETIKRLSDLAHVGSLSQGSTDITAPFLSAADRVSEVRAERRGLLRALGRATTDREIDTLKARLRANRSALSQAKGELQALRRRATHASVGVVVQGTGTARGHDGGGAWTPRDALRDAQRVLEVAAGVALVALAIALPLTLLAGLAGLASRTLRRRRRAHALDGA